MGKNKKAFTLLEIIIVIVILGVLASVALPRYNFAVERARAGDGVNMLTAVLGAQKRWAAENGAYATSMADLDIEIHSNNFDDPDPAAPAIGSNGIAASVTRNGAAPYNYTLSITEQTGTISCSGGADSICTKMGY